MYLSALAYVAQLRTQNATLTFQNQTLQHHLTLHRSHLSFVLRDRVNATRLSSVVAEQLSQMEASHERLLGVHYSSTCGLRRDEYCKLLIDHHQTQKQFRRLHSSHQLLRYRFQHLVIQMAVTYVKNPPVRPIQVISPPHLRTGMATYIFQVVFVNHSRPLTSLFVSSQQDPSSSFPIQAQPAPVSAPLQVIRPPPHSRVPAEGVHPPDVPSPSKTPRERARSDTAPSPPDLYYPPSPTVAPALNNEPGDGDGSSGSSSSSIDYTTRSASERLVEVAAFVQLIEKKIPYNNGQRKCIICGYVDLPLSLFLDRLTAVPTSETLTLSSAFTGGNFQILSEHLRADHPRCLEKLSM